MIVSPRIRLMDKVPAIQECHLMSASKILQCNFSECFCISYIEGCCRKNISPQKSQKETKEDKLTTSHKKTKKN